jgi:long-chain acyl-CoA synthetase
MTNGAEQAYREKGDTWPKILKYNYEKYGDNHKAMRYKHYGIWQPYTWKDYYLSVKYLALGLLSLGFEPGDKLLIIGDNAPQWYYAELAAQANHGASVGLYSGFNPFGDKVTVAENSEAKFAVVEDQEQVDKFFPKSKMSSLSLRKLFSGTIKGLAHYDDPVLMGYRQALELGEKYEEAIKKAKANASFTKKIEVEVTNASDALKVANAGADIIMAFDECAPYPCLRKEFGW